MKQSTKKKKAARKGRTATKRPRAPEFTPAEQRAARSSRIRVEPAEPFGWMALSEAGGEPYHLFCSPETRTLQCTCADFIFRGEDIGYSCKHVISVKLYIADQYLKNEYSPERQQAEYRQQGRPQGLPRAA